MGGALLGTAWCGALKRDKGGVGAIGGSFVVALALLHLFVANPTSYEDARNEVLVVVGALVWFALGLALARGAGVARVFAVAALAALGVLVVAAFAKWDLGADEVRFLGQATFGALGVAAAALVFELPGLAVPQDAAPENGSHVWPAQAVNATARRA